MKKFLFLVSLLFISMTFSQTIIEGNLIIDQDIQLGSNCGQGNNETIIYTGDCNFNSYQTVTLKGVNLVIQGNINGSGLFTNFCSNSSSSVCYEGFNNAGNNITYQNVTLSSCSLNLPEFDFNKDLGYEYKAYDFSGRLVFIGITSLNILNELPKGILIIRIENFRPVKVLIY